MSTDETYSLKPEIGLMVQVWYYGNSYRAQVIKHGKKYPTVAFQLNNGRRIEGKATIIEHDAAIPQEHKGYLGRMLHPSFYDR